MKTLIFGMVAFLFSINIQAQNNNVKSEVKTTVTTVKSSDGQKKSIKTQEVKEIQKIELKDAESNALNKERKETPVEVTAITSITANGVTNIVDVDRSAYYDLNGQKYEVKLAESGYTIYQPNAEKAAVLRKTSNNNYIYSSKNKTSYGYFDANGNLVLESYDDKTDKITVETFVIIKK
ncbi:MAG: hypothetical protein Q8R22_12140 [Flavobacterium sp.]|jgi:hypothetical protein|uniref:hypothetical protein n=1 Tax=unclassified Flavobacterium TaxID=196869 RepID=UPI000C1956EC|nr:MULTISPECIES: hypothetical protein [unclassified Flavobacterium]MDP3681573.1 hypothetical protein [Flavobacterium sp.]PIF62245.1 hypothetical protein CLV00_1868 [Flavobacterium sp. 11]RKS14823.1 hypothetical protein C8C87_2125 [Flavobacterium sp. 120]WKL43392.1 hypothetical protein Q1W72_13670 [Flavobacterium sp. ZE23DGlu08]